MNIAKTAQAGVLALAFFPAAAFGFSAPTATIAGEAEQPPRTLILALDGISYRTVLAAREQGAFEGWPREVPMISTFPSVTNVAFTALFNRFGAEPANGYEVSHFSREENDVVGGSLIGYKQRINSWREHFDLTCRAIGCKLAAYTSPRRVSRNDLHETERLLFDSFKEVVLAHIGATDALIHLRGDDAAIEMLIEVDEWIAEQKQRHLAERGRPLRVVLMSDHGNSDAKIHMASKIRRRLRKAGLNVVAHLDGPDDVVAPTFGLVSYGALFLRHDRAEIAARAVVDHKAMDLAAWISGEREISIIGFPGDAVVRWREGPEGRSFRYEEITGDPLHLAGAVADLAAGGLMDADGFAREDEWLRASAQCDFPDAPRRLADALVGPYVRNKATVIFSLKPGYAWGWKSAHVGSKLNGGRLEGTHGGLDRISSLAFFLTDDPLLQPSEAISINDALAAFEATNDGLAFRGPTGGDRRRAGSSATPR
jgi:hypothetical protein